MLTNLQIGTRGVKMLSKKQSTKINQYFYRSAIRLASKSKLRNFGQSRQIIKWTRRLDNNIIANV
jgi:hypothetical protein